ncbi:histone-lysine N-methyltransferase CLF-like isoform X3 [Phoenix dactylifera]|uniref:[histone H3]-lysine(27) N-trimethyltransferase n=1 Tax=Phoenix dactylifera TaxID=42345 RepID=A0A8B8ZCN6_PHODC|nr:histone-lysine N-methyltransferase CLF-like isoform X3 [Phoenix dactylifera]
MASKASSSASATKSEPSAGLQITGIKEGNHASQDILPVIHSLKKQIVADRFIYIKKTMEENKQKLSSIIQHLYNLSKFRRDPTINNTDVDVNLLTKRQDDALCTLNSLELSGGEKDSSSCQEESSYASSTVILGSNFGGKNAVRPIKLPEVPKLPPYTTWIFLDRNQRMTEDQSVVGRRRIYYDRGCGEALICSDSEDDVVEDEEEKKEFGSTEDYIIRMVIQKVGLSDAVLDSLAQCLERKTDEIRARYESIIKIEKTEECVKKGEDGVDIKIADALSEKDLDAALDSFDNLFCRRCLVFDCRRHGCSQDLLFPVSKSESIATMNSQMSHVFEFQAQSSGSARASLYPKKKSQGSSVGRRAKYRQSESASSNARVVSESSKSEVHPRQYIMSVKVSSHLKINKDGKYGIQKKDNKRIAEQVLLCMRKKQKKMVPSDSDKIVSGHLWPHDMKLRSNTRIAYRDSNSSSQNKIVKSPIIRSSRKKGLSQQDSIDLAYDEAQNDSTGKIVKESLATDCHESSRKEEFVDKSTCKYENTCGKSWKVIERSLFVKGLEIFGRNSCLIARNLLCGMKTCMEVFQHMNYVEDKKTYGAADGANSLVEGYAKTRSRFLRRRGRVRRLKYTWKSAGYHSIRKRITEKKDQPCRQYNPCGCQSACGKQCPCLVNGTCCEKYCRCPKICKNRFRGCHCAKSQCRSRQCPCFAADRECDPDVCRNCWIGCGDGTLGGPNQRGDNYECRNMKLLLKQQQRVLLGRSDVSGWGAFLKNSVGKHEYLGEYTGELISHREADKRGKIYDRENSSFLFNLNDQFVLDAHRKGDKLKFANHSPNPNCYAKVIMVAGDHRVGIFAKERISAGEELFYDYRYEADRAPAWARKPEASGSRKGETQPSGGRAKKLA